MSPFSTLAEAREQMSGWARGGRTSKIWHQISEMGRVPDTNIRRARLLCSGQIIHLRDSEPYDYRWRPPSERWCLHPACRAEVEP